MKTLLEKINMVLKETDHLVEKKGDGDEYEEFFRKMLKKWGVKEPDELSRKERKKFFKEVEDKWKKEDPKTNDKDR